MRLSYIIGIILILTFPTSVAMVPQAPTITHSAAGYDYNFTSLPLGGFPANQSWVGFSTFNVTSPSGISVEHGHDGLKGLQVSTYGYNGVGNQFLNISLRSNSIFSLRVTFSWNYNNSDFESGNKIEITNGSNENMGYHFGPLYNKDTYLTGVDSSNLGPDPAVASFYTLDIAWRGNSDVVYTNILRGWNTTMNLPYAIMPEGSFNGQNFSLDFGGTYSNLTIYNIYMDNGGTGFETASNSSGVVFNHETVVPDFAGINVSSTGWMPVVDQTTNSIIYSGNSTNPGVFAYNYYNNTSRELYSLPRGFAEITSREGGGYGYFLYANVSSGIFVSINLESMEVQSTSIKTHYEIGTHILILGMTAYILAKNGTTETISNTGNGLNQSGIFYHDLGILASSGDRNGNLTVSFFTNGTSSIIRYDLLANGTLLRVGSYINTLFDSTVKASIGSDSLPVSTETPVVKEGYNETIVFGNNGSEPLVLVHNDSVVRGTGNTMLLNSGNHVYAVSGSTVHSTNMESGSVFLYISDNLSFGMGIYRSSIVLYYTGPNPFSDNGISLQFTPPSVLTGNVSLNYSVNSSLNYTIQAQIGNVSLFPAYGHLNLSTRQLDNGTYYILMQAWNEAGYSTSVNCTVHVDNFKPSLILTPGNGSVVLENSSLEINITGLEGSVNSTVEFGNLQSAVFQGESIGTFFPEATGTFRLYLNITDEFGINRDYTFYFEIQGINSTGYHSNIIPGSFLSSGSLNITWTPVKFIKYYRTELNSVGYYDEFNTSTNYTHVKLPSGSYKLSISALLENSSWIEVVNESFTVQLYNPSLNFTHTNDHFYSFFGDSSNDTLNITATSNVSVTFSLRIYESNNTVFQSNGTGNTFSIKLNSTYPFLAKDGIYMANLSATERSGRTTWKQLNFSVNNTIPKIPLDFDNLYTNITDPSLNLTPTRNETIAYYYSNGTLGGYLVNRNSKLNLTSQSSKISLETVTHWGNYNKTNLTILKSSVKPVIDANVSSKALVWNNTLQLAYSIQDPVNLSSLTIRINNLTVYNSTSDRGQFYLTLPNDGNYTVYIKTGDVCGNTNVASIQGITCEYYPHIGSLNSRIGMFMGFAHLVSTVKGNYLESVNYSWIVDDSTISNGMSTYALLLPGYHNITFEANYHHKSIKYVHHVFTVGFIPELLLAAGIVALVMYRRYSGDDDLDGAMELVLENTGMRRNEIFAVARKKKIRVKTVEAAIGDLTSNGKVRVMPDPDGVMYVMGPKYKQ